MNFCEVALTNFQTTTNNKRRARCFPMTKLAITHLTGSCRCNIHPTTIFLVVQHRSPYLSTSLVKKKYNSILKKLPYFSKTTLHIERMKLLNSSKQCKYSDLQQRIISTRHLQAHSHTHLALSSLEGVCVKTLYAKIKFIFKSMKGMKSLKQRPIYLEPSIWDHLLFQVVNPSSTK